MYCFGVEINSNQRQQLNKIGFIKIESENSVTKPPIAEISFTHCIAFGETGSGKTTSFIYPNLNHRIENNHAILLYDFKSKEHLALKAIAHYHNRLGDVIQIGQPYGAKINIIEYISDANIEKLFDKLFNDNEWWGTAAVSLSVTIYKILKTLRKINEEAKLHGLNLRYEYEINFARNGVFSPEQAIDQKRFNFDIALSFKNIFNIFSQTENFVCFVDGLSLFINHYRDAIFETYKNNIKSASVLINLYTTLTEQYASIDTYRLMNYKPESNKKSSGHYGVLLIIQNALKTVAGQDYLNSTDQGAINIIDALNTNKIIVINTASFSPTMLNIFNDSIFEELSRRASDQSEKNAISIFIDEAQRVLDEKSDVPIDVLREARVDVFFASQSHFLMLKSMGEKNWFALETNITKQYNFRSKNDEYASLEDHEYIFQDEEHQAEPIFFNIEYLHKIELLYQNMNGIQKKYNLNKTEIIEFDLIEFEKDYKLKIYDIKNKMDRKICAINYLNAEVTNQNIMNFMKFYSRQTFDVDAQKENDELDAFFQMLEEENKKNAFHSLLTD